MRLTSNSEIIHYNKFFKMLYFYPSCLPVVYTQTVILKTLKNPQETEESWSCFRILVPFKWWDPAENSQEFPQANFYLQQSFQPDEN